MSKNGATIAVMLAVLMVQIDITVANVSLPHIMGSLGTTVDKIPWILTSYSMAEAIFIPITSFWVARFGERKVMLVAIIGFTIASMLCGTAQTLAELVIYRIFQGMFGASMLPLAQSTIAQLYPAGQRGRGMAIFSIGILLGPIFGPIIGGIITDNINWRWIFYINLPVGLISIYLIYKHIHLNNRSKSKFDWWLVSYMAIFISSLQFILDRGNEKDWLDSKLIQILLAFTIIGGIMWIYRSLKTKGAIAPLWVLKDRNLLASSIIGGLISMCTSGLGVQLSILLEEVLNYPVLDTGLLMTPRGLVSALVLVLVIKFNPQFDPRLKILFGLICIGIGNYLMTKYSLNIDTFWIVFPGMVQGLGLGLAFSTLSVVAYLTLPTQHSIAGASIYNLFRILGSASGISIVTTLQYRDSQQQWHGLTEGFSPYNPDLQKWLQLNDLSITDPESILRYENMIYEQSQIVVFTHMYQWIGMSVIFLIPLLLLIKVRK
ncbi:MDR family MFS transporter [Aliivibrio fischeri]|uniref:MDR family MFS transporter n=1 Tax=Aliivibrio fischeri TaxID=668 RepID=UPI001F18D519|nr:MDR family MFS transporter [Aliivibrio fischeri]MCE4936488.1 multidrug efflux MFS transporter [Aliivibrio fischeri]